MIVSDSSYSSDSSSSKNKSKSKSKSAMKPKKHGDQTIKSDSDRSRKRKHESLAFDFEKIVEKDGRFISVPVQENKNGEMKRIITDENAPFRLTSWKRRHSHLTTTTKNDESELLLDKVVTPLLRNAGWKINLNLSFFQFKVDDSTTYNIGRDQMLACMKRIQPLIRMYGDSIIYDSSFETTLENLVIEDFMVTRSHRYIELEEIVQKTLIKPDKKEIAILAQKNKHVQQITPVQKNKHVQKNTPVQKDIPVQKKKRKQTNDSVSYEKVTQKVPKFYLYEDKRIVDAELIHQVQQECLKKVIKEPSITATTKLLNIYSLDVEDDPFTLVLVIKGRKDIVNHARKSMLKKIRRLLATYNVHRLLSDGKNYEIDVKIDLSKSDRLGIVAIPQSSSNSPGLWLKRSSTNPDEGIGRILGSAMLKGAVLLKLKVKSNWINLYTKDDKDRALDEAKKGKEKKVTAKVCLSKDANIDDLDFDFIPKGIVCRDGHRPPQIRPVGKRKKEIIQKQRISNLKSATSKKRPSITSQRSNGAKISSLDRGSIKVSLKPKRKMLGLFFTNENGKCVVTSVDPNGCVMESESERIQKGSTVIGASVDNNEMRYVESWKELERIYNILKQNNGTLNIWFSVSSSNANDESFHGQDWTETGAWIGSSSKVGWAGGSSVVSVSSSSNNESDNGLIKLGSIPPSKSMKEKIYQQRQKDLASNQKSLSNHPKLRDAKTLKSSKTDKTLQPILKKVKEDQPRMKKKISINESKNQIFLVEGRLATLAKTNQKLNQEKMMEAAISPRQSISMFVKGLKQNPSTKNEFYSLSKAIHEQIETFQEHKTSTNNQVEYDSFEKDLKALKLKKAALHIFETAGDVIDMSRHINEAVLINFMPSQVNLTLSSGGERSNVENHLYCSLYVNRTFKKSTSTILYEKQSNWHTPEKLSILHTKSNHSAYLGKDTAVIELRKGSPENSIVLGSISLNLSMITESPASKKRTFDLSTRDSNSLLRGSLLLEHNITPASDKEIESKRLEIAKKTKGLICWMKKFNSQSPLTNDLIDANISSFDNISLLHVAVSCCDRNLVCELLKMRGDKETLSASLGTPIHYARTMVKKFLKEKKKFHEIIQTLSNENSFY